MNQWGKKAELYQAYFEDNDNRVSSKKVFPGILKIIGDVSNKKILDFGCGQGRFSRVFHDMGAHVYAYDNAQQEIEIACSLNNGRDIKYSFNNEIFMNQCDYDLVWCFMALLCNPHEDVLDIIKKIYNCLKTNGFACFVNTNTETLGFRFQDFYSIPPDNLMNGSPYKTIIPTSKGEIEVTDYYYSPEHLRDVFLSNNFEIVNETVFSKQFIFHLLQK
jgi:SAM-dependent methyltransferase